MSCVDGRSRYLYIVLGGYLRILGAPSVQSCCTLWISVSYRVFDYMADITNPDLFVFVVVEPGVVVVVVCPLQPSSSVNSGCPGPES